jgi:RNA polymerase II subunit A-like phosphatase
MYKSKFNLCFKLENITLTISSSDFALWVKSFGAKISTHVNKFTTHVIANPEWKTTKVKKAARFINIQIVTAEWMFQCCTRWEHVDEGPYLIEMGDADRDGSPMEDGLEDGSFTGDESVDGVESPKFEMSDDMWSSLNNELDDFLNESDDTDGASASDSDSVRSTDSGRSEGKTKKKRKRGSGVESNDGSEADDSDASVKSASSKLQRKKKRTMERVTSLTAVENAERTSGLPSPETTGPEEEQGDEEGKTFDPQGEGPDLDSDFDDGLEAAMMDEFEKSGNED